MAQTWRAVSGARPHGLGGGIYDPAASQPSFPSWLAGSTHPPYQICVLAWSPDGKVIATAHCEVKIGHHRPPQGTLRTFDAVGDRFPTLHWAHYIDTEMVGALSAQIKSLSFSPDSK